MGPQYPARQAIGDFCRGHFVTSGEHSAFVAAQAEEEGALWVVRYALGYLGKPQYCIVPELVVLDYGDALNGEDAWQFLLNKSNLYPRADVLGHRNDGVDEMIVVKKLDLATPVDLLFYDSATATHPVARTRAVIASSTDGLPERVGQYAQLYLTPADWEAELYDE